MKRVNLNLEPSVRCGRRFFTMLEKTVLEVGVVNYRRSSAAGFEVRA